MRAGRTMIAVLWLGAAACKDAPEKAPAPAPAPTPAPAPAPAPATPSAADAAPAGEPGSDVGSRGLDVDEIMGRSKEDLTATPATCDPAGEPTRAWAYQDYLRNGGKEHAHPYVHFRRSSGIAGLHELVLEGGPDQPSEYRLAYAWRCRTYQDQGALAKVLLRDLGWPKADAARRAELAGEIDRWMFDVVQRQPDDWDAAETFTPPEAKAMPGGAVQLTRWAFHRRVISYSTGKVDKSYLLQRVTFSAAGAPGKPKTLRTIKLAPNARSPNPFR